MPLGDSALVTLSGAGASLGLAALDGVDPDAVISQVQASNGACFAAPVSVNLASLPPFPATADVIDPAVRRTRRSSPAPTTRRSSTRWRASGRSATRTWRRSRRTRRR